MEPYPERMSSASPSTRHMVPVAEERSIFTAHAREPINTDPLGAETAFYRGYSWCLNVVPTIREIAQHLRQELTRLDESSAGWQRTEIMTNVFLLSCAIADTVDDYVVGVRFDFSIASGIIPGIGPAVRAAEVMQNAMQRTREWTLDRVRTWRAAWGASVVEFLKVFVAGETPDPSALRVARTRLTSLLATDLPAGLDRCHPGILHAFRTLDLTHGDILTLGRRFITEFPKRERPVLVVGLRAAGSYFAPLLHAMLATEGYRDLESVTIRPKKGLSRWERATLARGAKKGSLAVIIDEPPNSGATAAKAVDLVREAGYATDDVVVLLPIHPSRRDWAMGQESLPLSGIRILPLEPEQWHKCRLLEPETVESRVAEYFTHRNYASARVVASAKADQLNLLLQRSSEEKFHTRLKRIYAVRLEGGSGQTETRFVLAKSVGWGWFSYHAFIAGERLSAFAPPLLGLRDGILYTEWLPQAGLPATGQDRSLWLETAASYVAARARCLSLVRDPSPDISRANQHRGFDALAGALSRAYGVKGAVVLKRARLQHELARRHHPFPTLIDAKMRPQEWIAGPTSWLKTDYEHHGLGRKQLNVTDPAYDLADAIFYWGLSEAEEGRLINHYTDESGDTGVKDRLFLNKLLAGTVAMTDALANLDDGRLSERAQEFNRLYLDAWNFMTAHTARLCGRICGRPATLRWRSPLIVLDIDGVLDKQIFGFPSTSAAGLRALSLLHAHNAAVAANTARPLLQVQEYSRAYGFVGGVAEYGATAWDAVGGRERILVSSESLDQLERVRSALRQMPGVFLDEGYRFTIRAYTYERGATVPLPTLFIRDLLAGQKADRLDFRQTYVDTAIVAKEIDKGKGLLALLELVGQRHLETVAIGDSEPDLAMFRVARRSFAPAHISGRSVARMLGCRIANRRYQAGFLSSVRSILHPDGGRCDLCRSGARLQPKEAGSLFWQLLEAADQGRVRLLLQALSDPLALRVFAR